ncbi:hypothetical protein PBRA_006482 [Plasmodiophora brassicae]|uniref:Actin-related protein 8 n=1 Tax=Plasmodiophora brassicae TaxID=37360 RepID=A0A0G4ISM7_PLABS|nr:hypothetical protein PBRA_006482 [Plasmodiophora brassicae]
MADVTDATKIIVLQPGSAYLRYGFAADDEPRSIPHVVAYRAAHRQAPAMTPLSDADLDIVRRRRNRGAKESMAMFKKKFKPKYDSSRAPSNGFFGGGTDLIFDETNSVRRLDAADENPWPLTDVSGSPSCVVGDDALHIPRSANYRLVWPIVRGRLASSEHRTTHSAIDALYDTFSFAFRGPDLCTVLPPATPIVDAPGAELGVARNERANRAVALVVSDLMTQREIVDVHDLLLDQLGVGAVFVHRESILACLGAGLSTCCVVDIGKEKTHVACVREGLVVPGTSFVAYYGSDHIAETFLFLLRACSGEFGFDREHYFPFQDANLSDPQHFAVLDDLKVRACAFPPSTVEDVEFSQPYDIVLDGTRYSMNITQAGYLAPLALFQCDLLGPGVYVNTRHALHYLMDDVRPFDYMGKEVMETAPQIAGRAKDMARKTVGPTGDDAVPMSELAMEVDMGDNLEKDRDRTEEDSAYSEVASVASVETSPTPLHELVAASIGAVRDIELCRTLLSQIIIVGGSAKFKGFIEECEDRVLDTVASSIGASDRVEVLQDIHQSDPSNLSWLGAAILAQSTGCWITSKEWTGSALLSHVHLLRAKVAFQWDS